MTCLPISGRRKKKTERKEERKGHNLSNKPDNVLIPSGSKMVH